MDDPDPVDECCKVSVVVGCWGAMVGLGAAGYLGALIGCSSAVGGTALLSYISYKCFSYKCCSEQVEPTPTDRAVSLNPSGIVNAEEMQPLVVHQPDPNLQEESQEGNDLRRPTSLSMH